MHLGGGSFLKVGLTDGRDDAQGLNVCTRWALQMGLLRGIRRTPRSQEGVSQVSRRAPARGSVPLHATRGAADHLAGLIRKASVTCSLFTVTSKVPGATQPSLVVA